MLIMLQKGYMTRAPILFVGVLLHPNTDGTASSVTARLVRLCGRI